MTSAECQRYLAGMVPGPHVMFLVNSKTKRVDIGKPSEQCAIEVHYNTRTSKITMRSPTASSIAEEITLPNLLKCQASWEKLGIMDVDSGSGALSVRRFSELPLVHPAPPNVAYAIAFRYCGASKPAKEIVKKYLEKRAWEPEILANLWYNWHFMFYKPMHVRSEFNRVWRNGGRTGAFLVVHNLKNLFGSAIIAHVGPCTTVSTDASNIAFVTFDNVPECVSVDGGSVNLGSLFWMLSGEEPVMEFYGWSADVHAHFLGDGSIKSVGTKLVHKGTVYAKTFNSIVGDLHARIATNLGRMMPDVKKTTKAVDMHTFAKMEKQAGAYQKRRQSESKVDGVYIPPCLRKAMHTENGLVVNNQGRAAAAQYLRAIEGLTGRVLYNIEAIKRMWQTAGNDKKESLVHFLALLGHSKPSNMRPSCRTIATYDSQFSDSVLASLGRTRMCAYNGNYHACCHDLQRSPIIEGIVTPLQVAVEYKLQEQSASKRQKTVDVCTDD